MENLTSMLPTDEKNKVAKFLTVFLVVLSVFFVVKIAGEIKNFRYLGTTSAVSFEGKGEVMAVPDIVTISFSVREEKPTMKEAQDNVSIKTKEAVDFVKGSGIDEKDIKTSNYSSYPKYEFKYETDTTCGENTCPVRPTNQFISGYEVSQTINIKIKNTDDAGKILDALATIGVSDVQGPNFEIDDIEKVKAEARKEAIDDATSKAKILAKDLGVNLGRVVNFYESGNNYYPIMDNYSASMMKTTREGGGEITIAPVLPAGENTITSNVTITYEIK